VLWMEAPVETSCTGRRNWPLSRLFPRLCLDGI